MNIQLNGISKNFGTRTLFEDVSLSIAENSKIGLIGRNGCGKSTLLKIIMGIEEHDTGSIYRAPNLQCNYLSQEPRITPENTLEQEMRSVFKEINALNFEELEVLRKLEAEATEAEHMALAKKLDHIHRELERLDARSIDARIGRILKGLGFSLADHQRKTREFSGGWQMRINLAKVLLEGADILLLDEPTNHLDLEACEWLEEFLSEFSGGLAIVSHDRHFLDRVTTETAEMEFGKLRVWPGNYTRHLQLKAEELEQLASAKERQDKELEKQSAFVERFRASATRSTQAKSREKQLNKIVRITLPDQDKRRMAFRFPTPQPSGKQVLTVRGVAKSFGDKKLFEKLDANIERGERIFLLGANGTGKTTLLKLILGQEPLDAGEIRPGHNMNAGYFSQNQLDTLDAKLSVFKTMQDTCPDLTDTELRNLLGRFLFSGDEVFKNVAVLSGGEKSKLALAKLMMSGANTLFLDEPTNHMDIPAKEVITEALLDYEGSILCISHDRYFIQELSTDIWELYNGKLLVYGGDYEYYLRKRDEMRARFAPAQAPQPAAISVPRTEEAVKKAEDQQSFRARKEAEKQFKKVEKNILSLETEIAELETKLHDPALQNNYQDLQAVSEEIQQKQGALEALNEEWAELAETLS